MFPTPGSTIPEIRFQGFTETWKQQRLGEVGKARSGVGFPDIEQGGTTGIPFFKVSDMNLDSNENEMTVANNYVTADKIAAYRWSPITELPAIFFAKVGAAVMLNRKRLCRFPFLLDNNTMAYSLSSTKWDANFAKALFETVDLTSLIQLGALPSYNAEDVESMEIYLPEVLEQKKIGAYFSALDSLVALHQHKLNKLHCIKKALLEKMFV
ncbi:Type I restriction modification DNA specificity domain [Chlamydia trachomatis]|nr:Type I restriction modification DNA specificity domain [Chlamydia trachomatis]